MACTVFCLGGYSGTFAVRSSFELCFRRREYTKADILLFQLDAVWLCKFRSVFDSGIERDTAAAMHCGSDQEIRPVEKRSPCGELHCIAHVLASVDVWHILFFVYRCLYFIAFGSSFCCFRIGSKVKKAFLLSGMPFSAL